MGFGRRGNSYIFCFRALVLLSLGIYVFAARDLLSEAPAGADPLSNIHIPAILQPPSRFELHAAYPAKGYQYYRYNGSSWVNFNASAILRDPATNKKVARHFFLTTPDALGGQPSWESLNPRSPSIVTAKSIESIHVSKHSINWVLLKATHTTGSRKEFGDVAFVQRLATSAGLPPISTKGAKVGDVRKSKYSAVYTFYVPS